MSVAYKQLAELFPECVVSFSQSKRFILQGGVSVNGKKVEHFDQPLDLKPGDIVTLGKKKSVTYHGKT